MEQNELESILIKNLPNLKSQAFNLTKNKEDAEDLVNDVCLKILTSKDKIYHNQNLNGWFSVILKNIFINNFRKKIRHGETEIIENAIPIKFSTEESDNDIIYKDLLNEIDISYPGYKEFIAWLNGYTYQQISDIFEANIGTIKSRIFVFRKNLKNKLKRGQFC